MLDMKRPVIKFLFCNAHFLNYSLLVLINFCNAQEIDIDQVIPSGYNPDNKPKSDSPNGNANKKLNSVLLIKFVITDTLSVTLSVYINELFGVNELTQVCFQVNFK